MITELAIKEDLFFALGYEDEKQGFAAVEKIATNFKKVYTTTKQPKIGEAPLYRFRTRFRESRWEMWRESVIEKQENGKWVVFMEYIDNHQECINLCNRLVSEGNIVLKN